MAQRWAPAIGNLPEQRWAEEAIAAIIRRTGGNFHFLYRLLTQLERILEFNSRWQVTKDIVESTREHMVIWQS